LPLNDSIYPFPQGLPGSINKVFTPSRVSHFLIVLAVNSGPLSERIYPGNATKNEQLKQEINYILISDLAGYQHRQTFSGVFINDIQYFEGSAISREVYHKIVAPDMALVFRPEPDT
jgi:hypothetical protein